MASQKACARDRHPHPPFPRKKLGITYPNLARLRQENPQDQLLRQNTSKKARSKCKYVGITLLGMLVRLGAQTETQKGSVRHVDRLTDGFNEEDGKAKISAGCIAQGARC